MLSLRIRTVTDADDDENDCTCDNKSNKDDHNSVDDNINIIIVDIVFW